MPMSINQWGLYTDFYELTMAQGYYRSGRKEDTSVFNYFFRENPFKGGFTVFAGLADFLDLLDKYTFSESDIDYLSKQGFHADFLNYLKTFQFSGTIQSVREGELVFPNEPVVQVEGNLIECQLIESMLLNILNFESLIATKAFRISQVTGGRKFSDFGLRRAQGFGALNASRASAIGGASSTSNVLAGKLFDIPLAGTQAHSWIQSFDDELEAFRAFVRTNPGNSTLLVDTYNTLQSGVPNAIRVAKEMEAAGLRLKAIRLDSGDLAFLSKKARKMLDSEGLEYVKIVASNQLNEYVIKSLLQDQNAEIDIFGIGTELITGKDNAALDGVYKLTENNGNPKMKFSENIEKITLPGKKQLLRCYDNKGWFSCDAILLENEDPGKVDNIYHPTYRERKKSIKNLQKEQLLHTAVKHGKAVIQMEKPADINRYLIKRAALLPEEHKRFISPHVYKVGISSELSEQRDALVKRLNH